MRDCYNQIRLVARL